MSDPNSLLTRPALGLQWSGRQTGWLAQVLADCRAQLQWWGWFQWPSGAEPTVPGQQRFSDSPVTPPLAGECSPHIFLADPAFAESL